MISNNEPDPEKTEVPLIHKDGLPEFIPEGPAMSRAARRHSDQSMRLKGKKRQNHLPQQLVKIVLLSKMMPQPKAETPTTPPVEEAPK